nr:protein SRG1-like [Tanacetum cinerariifolium]
MELDGKSLGGSLRVPCVQELAKESLIEVPDRYVHPNQDPIFVSATLTEVPIIDMQRLFSEESAITELERLHIACKDWGFFQMINHGVSCSLIEKVKEEIQEFFDLPMAEKNKFLQEAGDLEGFGQAYVFSEEQKLDWADMFYVVTLPHYLRKPHLLPRLPLPLRDTIEAYSKELKDISMKTLFLMAKALNMEVEDMNVLFAEGMQSMRMNYYPPCPQPENVIDGNWMSVKPLPNAFIVNIGDVLEIVTNGQYKSIEHRAVVNSEKERLSISTFLTPKLDGDFGPAPSIISPDTPPRFSRITVVDFLRNLFSKELDSKTNVDRYYL